MTTDQAPTPDVAPQDATGPTHEDNMAMLDKQVGPLLDTLLAQPDRAARVRILSAALVGAVTAGTSAVRAEADADASTPEAQRQGELSVGVQQVKSNGLRQSVYGDAAVGTPASVKRPRPAFVDPAAIRANPVNAPIIPGVAPTTLPLLK